MDKHPTTGYFVSIGRNIVSRKSKNQNIVAQFSAKVEYRDMASTTSELM